MESEIQSDDSQGKDGQPKQEGAGRSAQSDRPKRQKRERKQVLLRLDPAVHTAMAKWAADNLRSVNAQIEVVLREALKEAGRDPKAAPMRRQGRPRKSE